MTPILSPFVRSGSLHSPTFCRMLCDPSVFCRIWWSWCLNNNIWEKFASSYNPLFRVVQITILATARIARNTTGFSPLNGGKNVVYEVTNVEQCVYSPTWSQNGRTNSQQVTKGRTSFADKRCFLLRLTLTFSLWIWLEARKSLTRLSSPHRVPR